MHHTRYHPPWTDFTVTAEASTLKEQADLVGRQTISEDAFVGTTALVNVENEWPLTVPRGCGILRHSDRNGGPFTPPARAKIKLCM